MTKLYELPYEVRVRQKYIMFGVMIGITFMFFVTAVPYGLGNILRLTITHLPIQEYSLNEYIFIFIGAIALFIFMVWSCHWMWNTTSKPKKHPELENIGLKFDYEKVKNT